MKSVEFGNKFLKTYIFLDKIVLFVKICIDVILSIKVTIFDGKENSLFILCENQRILIFNDFIDIHVIPNLTRL